MGNHPTDYPDFDPNDGTTRKAAQEAVARDLTLWAGYSGPQARVAARNAVATLEREGWVTFAPQDDTSI